MRRSVLDRAVDQAQKPRRNGLQAGILVTQLANRIGRVSIRSGDERGGHSHSPGARVKDACGQVAAVHSSVRSRQLYDAVLRARQVWLCWLLVVISCWFGFVWLRGVVGYVVGIGGVGCVGGLGLVAA